MAVPFALGAALVLSSCGTVWQGGPVPPDYDRQPDELQLPEVDVTADDGLTDEQRAEKRTALQAAEEAIRDQLPFRGLAYVQISNAYYATNTAEPERRIHREQYADKAITEIDKRYATFKRELSISSKTSDLSLTLAALGLDTASVISTPTLTKSVLSGLAAFATGANSEVGKTLFYEKTVAVLIHQMEAARLAIYAEIEKGLKLGIDKYPLVALKKDLGRYHSAGTLEGALDLASETASREAETARTEITKSREIRTNNEAEVVRKRTAIDLWLLGDAETTGEDRLKQLRALARVSPQRLGLRTGKDIELELGSLKEDALDFLIRTLRIELGTIEELRKRYRERLLELGIDVRTPTEKNQAYLEQVRKNPEAAKAWLKSKLTNERPIQQIDSYLTLFARKDKKLAERIEGLAGNSDEQRTARRNLLTELIDGIDFSKDVGDPAIDTALSLMRQLKYDPSKEQEEN